MTTVNKQYDMEYKIQAVKLAKEIGSAKAAKELGIPVVLRKKFSRKVVGWLEYF